MSDLRMRPRTRTRAADPAQALPSLAFVLAAALLLMALLVPAPLSGQQEGEPAQEKEMDRFLAECGGEQEGEAGHGEAEYEGESRFSDKCKPLEDLPERPKPLLELGEPFLGTGTLGRGFTIPTGAVWQPSFVAFGTLRTALQGVKLDGVDDPLVEAVAQLNLFGNLYLTQTERVVVGFRPLDEEGQFTRFTIQAPPPVGEEEDFESEFNGELATLFFEGDLNELFPNLDKDDSGGGSWYFSVGRQPLAFQDGMLLNEDQMDMVGLTRANLKIFGSVNTRLTGIWGWGAINRPGGGGIVSTGNPRDTEANLFGLFGEIDFRSTTFEFDAAYVRGGDPDEDDLIPGSADGIYLGIGDTRRFGFKNNTFRVLASFESGETEAQERQGILVHNQFSWTPHHNYNFWYVNTFVGIDQYRPAALGAPVGGPLGRTGVLYAAPGIGRIGAPLGGMADDAVGGAIGHQLFFDKTRQQLLLEVAGRYRYSDPEGRAPDAVVPNEDVLGGGFRYQAAMGRRFVFVLDGIGRYDLEAETTDLVARTELVLKF